MQCYSRWFGAPSGKTETVQLFIVIEKLLCFTEEANNVRLLINYVSNNS